MKFTVVTPCFNAATRLAVTLESVLGQSAVRDGRLALEYFVCDGGSRDGTADLARSYPSVTVLSEPDRGMYDALGKGLRRATGDVVCYLNAGDRYHPEAFAVVAEVFARPEVRWLTGRTTVINPAGQVTASYLPYRYRPALIRAGLYGPRLPFIQQESTFWRRELMAGLDFERLAGFRLAGDHYLWTVFAAHGEPHIVASQLGLFAVEAGQLSEDRTGYFREMRAISGRPGPLSLARAAWERVGWLAPARFNRATLIRYDAASGRWR